MEVKIEEVYGDLITHLRKNYILGKIEENRAKMVRKLKFSFEEVKRLIEIDKEWANLERINEFYKSSLTTYDLSIRIRKEEVIKLFKRVWGMTEEEATSEGWDHLHINCYKTGRFVKDLFDYRYELEIIVDEDEEENLFKKLFLQLPVETGKSDKFENIFGTTSYKYKMVVLDIISEYFKEELINLKLGVDYSMDRLTLITKEKLGL